MRYLFTDRQGDKWTFDGSRPQADDNCVRERDGLQLSFHRMVNEFGYMSPKGEPYVLYIGKPDDVEVK